MPGAVGEERLVWVRPLRSLQWPGNAARNGRMKMKLWIVGKIGEKPEQQWEFQGVFDSEARAVAACIDWRDFVGPVTLNFIVPHETEVWPNSFYPITRTAA
jgi:hypothetical protein